MARNLGCAIHAGPEKQLATAKGQVLLDVVSFLFAFVALFGHMSPVKNAAGCNERISSSQDHAQQLYQRPSEPVADGAGAARPWQRIE